MVFRSDVAKAQDSASVFEGYCLVGLDRQSGIGAHAADFVQDLFALLWCQVGISQAVAG